ncbi:hypothetical protein ABV409_11925 [Flagellimonas sp. DF-77]|uniref:hypothetical protein n=1 Tax=Flagellimonas algarum TaxID=3230298 RepID=UPI003391AEAE
MKKEHQSIIGKITQFLEDHPDQRFGQAIFNLRINEFQKSTDPKNPFRALRDIYNDSDSEIIKRIEGQLEWFDLQGSVRAGIEDVVGLQSMTVNERLFATGLFDLFNTYKKSNKGYAEYILQALKVDSESIRKILK